MSYYCLVENQLHGNDSIAMHLFATQNANAGLIYYAWNTDSPNQTLPFCSIIMTDAGVIALREWGQTAAFMDTTYGVNKYGYAFTALIVKDSHSNHWPVAYMFHENETAEEFTTFLQKIKERAARDNVNLPEFIFTDISTAGNTLYAHLERYAADVSMTCQ
jgi:hypothetical protein